MDERLMRFYDDAIDRFGSDREEGVGWGTPGGQRERFEVLSTVGDLNGKSVLDMGCGFGDLYGYFLSRNIEGKYLGIDVNPRSIEIARKKYPGGDFETADFGAFEHAPFDYVLSSGALTFKIENYRETYFSFIEKMFALSARGCAFNMLDHKNHVDDATYAAYEPLEIEAFCRGLTDKVIIKSGYLPQDFTVFLYR